MSAKSPKITGKSNQPLVNQRIHCIVVAAGVGKRFGADTPKQYLQVAGKTILEHTIDRLGKCPSIDLVHLVLNAEDDWHETIEFSMPVIKVVGGAERWQSVAAGLQAIQSSTHHRQDLICIHDAARPCVLVKDVEAVIQAAAQHEVGAILGTPVRDTLKRVSNGQSVETIDRSELWQAQTPQVFRLHALQRALAYVQTTGIAITDEASAFELMDQPVALVAGSVHNLKLTHPDDAKMIESLLTDADFID